LKANTRVSQFRGELKTALLLIVEEHYQLKQGTPAEVAIVVQKLSIKKNFIFPGDVRKVIGFAAFLQSLLTRLLGNSLVRPSLREFCFPRSSIETFFQEID
jgi:hypothetical protein